MLRPGCPRASAAPRSCGRDLVGYIYSRYQSAANRAWCGPRSHRMLNLTFISVGEFRGLLFRDLRV